MSFFDDLLKGINSFGSNVGQFAINAISAPINEGVQLSKDITAQTQARQAARGGHSSFFDTLGDTLAATGKFAGGITSAGVQYSPIGSAERTVQRGVAQATNDKVNLNLPGSGGQTGSFTDAFKPENGGFFGGLLNAGGDVLGAGELARPAAIAAKAGGKAAAETYKANPVLSSEAGYIGGAKATGFPEAKAAGAVTPGVDNHPKFEVNDSQAKFDLSPLSATKSSSLPDVVAHPYLFQDYPQLKGVNVRFSESLGKGENGRFDPNTNTILLNPDRSAPKLQETIMHETQHAIQTIEGHAAGGNMDVVKAISDKTGATPYEAYRSLAGEAEARNVASRTDMTQAQREATPFNKTYDVAPEKQSVHFNDGQGGFFQDVKQTPEAPAKPIVEAYKVADDLKPVQSKTERLIKTQERHVTALQREINVREKQGLNISLKEPGREPLPGFNTERLGSKGSPTLGKMNTRAFVKNLVEASPAKLKALKKQVATRDNKLGPIIDRIHELSTHLEDVRTKRETATKEAKTLQRAGVATESTQGVTRDLKTAPKEVQQGFADWVNARGASEIEGVKAKQPFKELDKQGVEAFHKVQAGEREGLYGKLNDYFREKYHELKGSGIGQRYQKNYLPQLWKNDAEEVNKVFTSTATEKPSFTVQKVISDYQKGIDAGLTPRFDKISDLVGWYEKTANRAVADRKFLGDLKEQGRLIEAGRAPSGWKSINPDAFPGKVYKAEPALADAINNYLGQGSRVLQATSRVVGRTKGIVLGAGIPKTGLNFHGVSIFARSMLSAKNPLATSLRTGSWLVHTGAAEKFLNQNLDKLIAFRKAGLIASSEEHAFAREAQKAEGNIIQKLGNRASEWQQSLFEDPLFGRTLPAIKLHYADGLTKDLMKSGMTEVEAMRSASKSANDIFGGINTEQIARNKTFQQLLRTVLLAPDWLETQSRLATGIAKGTVKFTDPQFKAYRTVARNFLAAYVTANIVNKALSGHYMFENGPADQFSVDTGTTDDKGKKRLVKVFGGAADFVKLPYEMIQGIASGDPSAIGNIFRARLSGPASAIVSILSNTNPAKGNTPLFGPDKYGNPQTAGTQAGNIASILGGIVLPQPIQTGVGVAAGKTSIEQGLAGAVEAPITYRSPSKTGNVKASKGSGIKKTRSGTRTVRRRSTRIKVASVHAHKSRLSKKVI